MDMKLEASDAALMELAREGFDPLYSARPLKHAIQQQIENPLVKEILSGHFALKDIIRVDVVERRIVFEQMLEAEVVYARVFGQPAHTVRAGRPLRVQHSDRLIDSITAWIKEAL